MLTSNCTSHRVLDPRQGQRSEKFIDATIADVKNESEATCQEVSDLAQSPTTVRALKLRFGFGYLTWTANTCVLLEERSEHLDFRAVRTY